MAKIICVSNQKGGVGKTTTTNALALALKRRGYRVLAVDFDPQGNLSFGLKADNRPEMQNSVYYVMKGELKAVQAIRSTEYCDVIPANILLSGIELEFTGSGREYILRDALAGVHSMYDYILIDSPPALGILTVNAFTAADSVLMPVLSDLYSLQGIVQLYETLCKIKEHCNPELRAAGVLLTCCNPRQNTSKVIRETSEKITTSLGIPLLDTYIRRSSMITKAQILRKDIFAYAPKNAAAIDYAALTEELFQKGVL